MGFMSFLSKIKNSFGDKRKEQWERVEGQEDFLNQRMLASTEIYCKFPTFGLISDELCIRLEDNYIGAFNEYRRITPLPVPEIEKRDHIFATFYDYNIKDRRKRGVQIFGKYDRWYKEVKAEELGRITNAT